MEHAKQNSPEHPVRAVMLVLFLLSLFAALTAIVPLNSVAAHSVLHHLNFLPLMIAGMFFGWRGAILASIFAFTVNAPAVAQHWIEWPLDAKDQLLELSIFSAAGLIAGSLADRERLHRQKLERTRQELEQVYLELRENVAAMKKAERLSAAGQLAASLAHEIRNPLASISGAAGILQRGSAPQEFIDDSLAIIQKESNRLNTLLTGFLNFAKPRSPRIQPTSTEELLQSVVLLTAHKAEQRNITVSQLPGVPDKITCDPEQLKQVLLNLVINAIDASPAGAQIRVRALLDGPCAIIEVDDSGGGISDQNAEHLFDPFFTTKPQGTGLGLAISSMIVAQHGGQLSFANNARGGATFRIQLPGAGECPHAS